MRIIILPAELELLRQMKYKDIIRKLGISERQIAIQLGYAGQDPRRTMINSSRYRRGEIQALVEFLFGKFLELLPDLSQTEVRQRIAETEWLVELATRAGVETKRFKELRQYVSAGADPEDPEDARIIQAEDAEWHRILAELGVQ